MEISIVSAIFRFQNQLLGIIGGQFLGGGMRLRRGNFLRVKIFVEIRLKGVLLNRNFKD